MLLSLEAQINFPPPCFTLWESTFLAKDNLAKVCFGQIYNKSKSSIFCLSDLIPTFTAV